MKSKNKTKIFGIITVVAGVILIIFAHLFAGHVSWGIGWIITTIGWLLIAAVVIPICKRIKKSKGGS